MRISPFFLLASLALVAAEDPYLDIQLTTDASRRYLINAQIVSIRTTFLLNLPLTSWIPSRVSGTLPKTVILRLRPALHFWPSLVWGVVIAAV